jgi:hypothetical protein
MLSILSESLVGFCQPDSQKACTTCEMAPLTVLLTSGSKVIVRESAFSDSHGKSPKHEILFKLAELVEVRVVASHGLAILSPTLPSSSPDVM